MEQSYFHYNENTGVIYISGMIDDMLAINIADVLDTIAQTSPSLVNKPSVEIKINSGGGYLTSLISIIDSILINEEHIEINTTVCGQASSCAFIIWLMGHNRSITPNSYVLWHDVSYGAMPSGAEEHREKLVVTDKLRNRITKLITERTNFSRKEINNIYKSKSDRVWFAEEIIDRLK